jgi:hypothetical protein
MRQYALIAAATMVLTSASAYAGDSRSLTTSMTTDMPNGPAAPVQPPQADSSLRAYPDTASADTPRYRLPPSETPRYGTPSSNPRPAVVDNTPQATQPPQVTQTTPPPAATPPAAATPPVASTPPVAATPSANVDEPQPTTTHRAQVVHAHADRPHRRDGGHWTAGRIIAELHRYGVYW